jgi:hypothetical protein
MPIIIRTRETVASSLTCQLFATANGACGASARSFVVMSTRRMSQGARAFAFNTEESSE